MTAGAPHSQVKGAAELLRRGGAALVAAHPTRLARIDAGKALGISGSVTCVMASGRPVGIDAWLAWCAALGLDPVTAKKAARAMPGYPGGAFLWWFFGAAVQLRRGKADRDWSMRTLAQKSHVSIATLSRLETGTPVSVGAVSAVCQALRLHPHDYCQRKLAPDRREASAGGHVGGEVPRETAAETRCDQMDFAAEARGGEAGTADRELSR
mgnify:CR=1 FL=1